MLEEKKKVNNEEFCEEVTELSMEELEEVVGGINPSAVMPILFVQPFMQISPQIDR